MTGTDGEQQSKSLASAPDPKRKWVVHALLLTFSLVLAYIVGALIFNYNPPVWTFFGLSFVLLFFAIGQSLYEVGVTRTVVLFAITAIIGFGVEVLGANTGFLFGKYAYSSYLLGNTVFGVPVVVPLVWFVIVSIAFSLAFPQTSNLTIRGTSLSKLRTFLPLILLAAFGAVAWDFLIDPMFSSSQYRYWTWQISPSAPQLSGVPLTNFVGWFVVATGMLGTFVLFSSNYFDRNRGPAKLLPYLNTMDSRIAYVLLMIDGSVANEKLGHTFVVVIGVIAMTSFLLATIKFGTMKRKENRLMNS